jgi:hypothetical protein
MGRSDEIKIRTLPRGDEAEKKAKAEVRPKPEPKKQPQLQAEGIEEPSKGINPLVIMAALSAVILGVVVFGPGNGGKAEMSSVNTAKPKMPSNVDKYYTEAEIKREMMIHQMEIMNYNFKAAASEPELTAEALATPNDGSFGVSMDSEDSASSVFADLNDSYYQSEEMSPADRINARLATRKWINENDRAERVAALAAIIKNAYDQGYELQINSDLVVTGVKKINNKRPLNINQALDRLAKGQELRN